MSTELIVKHDVDWHATSICEAYGKSIESIIEIGRRVASALDELDHGEKASLWERLPFSQQTGSKLVAISESDLIYAHVRKLPPIWGTLHYLSRLDDESWTEADEKGLIHPKMERKQIEDFIKERGGMKTMKKRPKRKMNLTSKPKGLEKINYQSTLEYLEPVLGKEFKNFKDLKSVFLGKDSRSDISSGVQRAIGFAAGHPAFSVMDNGIIRIDHDPEIETLEKRNEELENKLKLKRLHDSEDVELLMYMDHLVCEFDAWEQTYGEDFRGIQIDKETRKEIKNSCVVLEKKASKFISYVKEIADV